jgi:hypothetical protein
MTHFTVLVRFEGKIEDTEKILEKLLEPYEENERVDPYKHYMSKEDVDMMAKNYGVESTDTESLIKKMIEWHGAEGGIDEEGLFYWSTYNPQSKWDWWSLGGRWSGRLVLKDGAKGVEGRPGVGNNKTGIDAAYFKDIDFETMRQNQIKRMEEYYTEFIEKAKVGTDPSIEMGEWIYNIHDDESMEQMIIRKIGLGEITASAVLDENGWHEPHKMGWFGCTYDETETYETWCNKLRERFLSNTTENTIIAMVDCHI